MPKTVIHILHDDDDSILLGTRVAQRILEVAEEHQLGLEVFCFGPAQKRLSGADGSDAVIAANRALQALLDAGVVVGACLNLARAAEVDADLEKRGFDLQIARDAFVRFTLEQATVITF